MQQAVSLVNLVGQYLPPLPEVDIMGLMMKPTLDHINEQADSGQWDFAKLSEEEQDQLVEDSMRDVSEKALFWSQKADMDEMEQVFELFKDSPQDQLILTKIRFEQRIIQVKKVLMEQGKVVD